MSRLAIRRRFTVPCALGALVLCTALPAGAGGRGATPRVAQSEVAEDELLDVGIQVLDPGMPREKLSDKELQEKGIFRDVRRSEARFIPLELKDTLESTGYWGAVRVVPQGVGMHDVQVSGTIVASNGKRLDLQIRVADATGRRWFDRRYHAEADPSAYGEEPPDPEPFHALYATIANDLLAERSRLKAKDIAEIRAVARMRFAADFAPQAYAPYLQAAGGGRQRLVRLPAAGDPVLERIDTVRERDHMLADTLNEHYFDFRARLIDSYDGWRLNSYEEQRQIDATRRSAGLRALLGVAAIAGAVLIDPNSSGGSTARDVLILGGVGAIESGMRRAGDIKMHKAALEELAESFEREVEPQLVEVDNHTVRLTGSAEEQYASWRQLLAGIFAADTGGTVDPNAPPAASAPVLPATAH